MNYSLTYLGGVILFLDWFGSLFDINVGPEEWGIFVKVTIAIIGAILTFYGRWRVGGVTWSGFRSKIWKNVNVE